MNLFEIASVAVNLLVLGTAVLVIRSGNTSAQTELQKTREAFTKLIDSLHALELKLTSCVTWQDMDRVCAGREAKIAELDRRVDAHDTEIQILKQHNVN